MKKNVTKSQRVPGGGSVGRSRAFLFPVSRACDLLCGRKKAHNVSSDMQDKCHFRIESRGHVDNMCGDMSRLTQGCEFPVARPVEAAGVQFSTADS